MTPGAGHIPLCGIFFIHVAFSWGALFRVDNFGLPQWDVDGLYNHFHLKPNYSWGWDYVVVKLGLWLVTMRMNLYKLFSRWVLTFKQLFPFFIRLHKVVHKTLQSSLFFIHVGFFWGALFEGRQFWVTPVECGCFLQPFSCQSIMLWLSWGCDNENEFIQLFSRWVLTLKQIVLIKLHKARPCDEWLSEVNFSILQRQQTFGTSGRFAVGSR